MLGKKLKIMVLTLVIMSIPVSVMAAPRGIIKDSVVINKGDGSVVLPPADMVEEVIKEESIKTEVTENTEEVALEKIALSGSISIRLADTEKNSSKEDVEFSLSKIADIEDGLYKVKDTYSGVEVDLNNIKTATDLELAAEMFKKVASTDNTMKTNANGECSIDDLEVGVYLVYAKNIAGYDNITPFIVSIPSWNETDKTMSYDIQVIPKHTEIIEKNTPKVPATAYDGSSIYLALGGISLLGSSALFFNINRKKE